MPIYRQGSKGEQVKRLQSRLKELGHYQGSTDGDFGPRTVRSVKSFQRLKGLSVDGEIGPKTWDALFAAITPEPIILSESTAQRNGQRLSRVHPILAIRGRCMIDLCASEGIAVLITQGLRTWRVQDKLYAKGRTIEPIGRGHIVTNAKGGQSFHNFGLAFDMVLLSRAGKADWDTANPAWKRAGEIGKSVDLEWGGDWKRFKDLPHFQYTGGLSTADCRKLYPSGLKAVWEKIQ